jgi:glycosyltransferase involved in cell wall biosynthesis
LVDWYLPGILSGGPVRSIYNFAGLLSEDYEITIVTSNKDLKSKKPYDGMEKFISIKTVSGVKVVYLSSKNYLSLIKIILSGFDIIFLNNIFSFKFNVVPLFINKLGLLQSKIILATRGMLHNQALSQKSFKKKVYLSIVKPLLKQKNLIFQASNAYEQNEIETALNFGPKIKILPNPVIKPKESVKISGASLKELKILYVSRICEHKNLLYIIKSLEKLRDLKNSTVVLNIYGFIEEENYWERCKEKILDLPNFIKVNYNGVNFDLDKTRLFESHHFLVLISKSENFGHIIYECISAGRPVIISNNTPWSLISKLKAGYVLNSSKYGLDDIIKEIMDMGDEKYFLMCENALDFSKNFFLKQNYLDNFTNNIS